MRVTHDWRDAYKGAQVVVAKVGLGCRVTGIDLWKQIRQNYKDWINLTASPKQILPVSCTVCLFVETLSLVMQ